MVSRLQYKKRRQQSSFLKLLSSNLHSLPSIFLERPWREALPWLCFCFCLYTRVYGDARGGCHCPAFSTPRDTGEKKTEKSREMEEAGEEKSALRECLK